MIGDENFLTEHHCLCNSLVLRFKHLLLKKKKARHDYYKKRKSKNIKEK